VNWPVGAEMFAFSTKPDPDLNAPSTGLFPCFHCKILFAVFALGEMSCVILTASSLPVEGQYDEKVDIIRGSFHVGVLGTRDIW